MISLCFLLVSMLIFLSALQTIHTTGEMGMKASKLVFEENLIPATKTLQRVCLKLILSVNK